jgi:PAS domain S-box-containing protein
LSELDVIAVASLVSRAMPGTAVTVFSDQLTILATTRAEPIRQGLTAEAAVGMLASDALMPERWERYEPLFVAALEGRTSRIELVSSERSTHHRVDVGPLRDATGTIVGGVCFSHDITERALLLEELDQQRQLLELANEAIIVRDPRFSSVTYWNREAHEIYGYGAEEVLGRVTHDLLATVFPDSQQAIDETLTRVGRWEGELRHRRKDGQEIIVSSRQALVHDGNGQPVAIIELNSDITERKRAEQALRDTEQRFRGLMESAPDAMVIVDEQGTIVLINARAEELFEYPRAELVGQPIEVLVPKGVRRRHVEHRKGFAADPHARPMGGGMDLLARRKGGSEFLAEISLSPLHTDSGLLISTSIRDISKQLLRQFEQALVPRMRVDDRWHLAWRYRPSVNAMLLGGDFIGVAERPDGSLSLLIGDVTGHGPSAAGTGAMLRAAWLGGVQGGVALESIPDMLHRLLVNQSDREAATLATVCLAELDRDGRELTLVRAGHDSPLLITPGAVTALNGVHGPALGLGVDAKWPVRRLALPSDAALMLFTDGLTERRSLLWQGRLGFDELLPRIDADAVLSTPPGQAIDEMLAQVFPAGTEQLDDDLAVILLKLSETDVIRADARLSA